MKLRWLCILLLVCLMSGSGIADDSGQENTQASSICENKCAMNSELCGDAISTSYFFERCLDDPLFCSPGNRGKVQEGDMNADKQSHVVYDVDMRETRQISWTAAAWLKMFENAYIACGNPALARDETLAMLETQYQGGSLSKEEFGNAVYVINAAALNTAESIFWNAFWEAFWVDIDDEMLDDEIYTIFENDAFSENLSNAYTNAIVKSEDFLDILCDNIFYNAYSEEITTTAEDMNEQFPAVYAAAHGAAISAAENADWTDPATAGIAIFEAAYATCGSSDIALVVTLTLFDTLYQEGHISEEELKVSVEAVFWEAFWEMFWKAFWEGFMEVFDEEMLAEIDELLADESLWELFDEDMLASIDELFANESLWELFDEEMFVGIGEIFANEAFWEGFMEAFDEEMLADIDVFFVNDSFWEASEEAYMGSIANEEANIAMSANELSGAAYDAGIKVAQEIDWTEPDAAGREIFEAAYVACGDLNIALQASLNLLETLYQKGSLSEEMLYSARYAAVLEGLGERFWEAYYAGITVAQEIDWTDPDAAGREIFEVVYATYGDQDIALEVTLGVLGALYQKENLNEEEWINAKYAALGERFGENAAFVYDAAMKGALEAHEKDPDAAWQEIFEAAYAACQNPYIALEVTSDLLSALYQEGNLSEEEWENATNVVFWEQFLLVSLPSISQA